MVPLSIVRLRVVLPRLPAQLLWVLPRGCREPEQGASLSIGQGQQVCSALGSHGSAGDQGTARMSLPNTVILAVTEPFWGHKTCFCMPAVRLGEQTRAKQG